MKRFLSLTIAVFIIASVAFAATIKLQINSGQKLNDQYRAFRNYLDKLSEDDREKWGKELARIVEEDQSSSQAFSLSSYARPEVSVSLTGTAQMVWIPKTGSKYHKKQTCSNMKNPRHVTKDEAISMGYERCSKRKP